ncbi:hypothetical protein CBR_g12735 [Chara braunii]|uniref:Uncharacterized protein n=1 Tax=Chara braunii TaxID=69332 RepID=A0A388KSJ7_CHABU|nr:hypothetical protein CBR_g12735 [Chara braunii]|eukprot:GBG73016.1 hypothetical protein CBR_g12735 [Chara braunii]
MAVASRQSEVRGARSSLLPSFLYSSAASSRSSLVGYGGASGALFPPSSPSSPSSPASPHFPSLLPFPSSAKTPSSPLTVPVTVPSVKESTLRERFYQGSKIWVPSPTEKKKIELYSREYYMACTAGGILSCGLTHMGVTPLDLVKCNMQIDPVKYKSIATGFGVLLRDQGARGLFRGWVPTLLGYSAQGACKFGLYEFFKKYYSDLAGAENAAQYKTLIFLAGSASAEFFADIALCPFEAVKVRVQTQPGFARGLSDGLPKFVASEGYAGLFKGIVPLWGRQIPYTMMKFAAFENTVEALYKYAVPIPKSECTKSQQLGVSFAAGYIAGVFCAVVSHPADNLVSFLNNAKGSTVSQEGDMYEGGMKRAVQRMRYDGDVEVGREGPTSGGTPGKAQDKK